MENNLQLKSTNWFCDRIQVNVTDIFGLDDRELYKKEQMKLVHIDHRLSIVYKIQYFSSTQIELRKQ